MKLICPFLYKLELNKWNFDLTDFDNILRIDTEENLSGIIINELKLHGFESRELE